MFWNPKTKTYCWWFRNPAFTHQLRLVVYPIVYKVLHIPGGCLGFLPSTVFFLARPGTSMIKTHPFPKKSLVRLLLLLLRLLPCCLAGLHLCKKNGPPENPNHATKNHLDLDEKMARFGPIPMRFWDSKFRWTPYVVCGGSLNWLNQPIPSAEIFFMAPMETEKKITKANLKLTPIPAAENKRRCLFVFTSSSVRKFVIFPFWGVRTRSGAIYIYRCQFK